MANEVQIKLARSAKIGGLTVGGVDESVPADGQQVFQQTIPTGTVDYQVNLPITVATVVVEAFHAKQSMTLCTNAPSTGVPGDTVVLKKDVPQIWCVGQPTLPVLTQDVTAFYVTNLSGVDGLLSIGIASKLAPTGPA